MARHLSDRFNNRKIVLGASFLLYLLSIILLILQKCSAVSIGVAFLIFTGFLIFIIITIKTSISSIKSTICDNWFVLLAFCITFTRTIISLLHYFKSLPSNNYYSIINICLCFLFLYAIVLFIYFFIKEPIAHEKLFLLQSIVFGATLMIVFPIYTVADEPAHFYTAYKLSNTMLGVPTVENGLYMRADDVYFQMENYGYSVQDYNQYIIDFLTPLENGDLIIAHPDRIYITEWYQYFAPALGITIGRLLHFNTVTTFLLGRLMNFLFYIIILYICIKLIPVGKTLLYTIALLPMPLQLAASASRDVFRICSAILVVTLSLYLFYRKEISHKKLCIATLIIAALLLLPLRSFVYATISVFPLILYGYDKKWITEKRIAWFVIVCFSLFILLLGLRLTVFKDFSLVEPVVIHSAYNVPIYTKEFVFNHPLTMMNMVKNTIITLSPWYWQTMIGRYLGWLSAEAPEIMIMLLGFILIFSSFKREYEEQILPNGIRFSLFSLATASYLLIILGMALLWTPATATIIDGVQGRYFLPIVLPFFLSLKGNSVLVDKKSDKLCMCALFVIVTLVIQLLPLKLL